jgi:predicted RNA-binding protein with PIN domain
VKLLIDGNNLLHASDVFPHGGDRSPAAAQHALVAALSAAWSASERKSAIIVFDGSGGVSSTSSDGPQIYFPRRRQDADEVLEELLQAEREPQRLLVVSSDHRIQRAARQAGAKYLDSEDYWQRLRRVVASPSEETVEKPESPSEAEVQKWLKSFRDPQS